MARLSHSCLCLKVPEGWLTSSSLLTLFNGKLLPFVPLLAGALRSRDQCLCGFLILSPKMTSIKPTWGPKGPEQFSWSRLQSQRETLRSGKETRVSLVAGLPALEPEACFVLLQSEGRSTDWTAPEEEI